MKQIQNTRKFILGGMTAIVLVAAAVTIYACNKDKELNTTQDGKQMGNIVVPGALVNPFEQYGIWHNECLNYMLSQEGANTLTTDEMWINYGIPFFQNVLGADYVEVPLSEINAISVKVRGLIDVRNTVSLIEDLATNGDIDANFTSPYISRNNYTILHDFFSYMDNVTVNTIEEYRNVQTVLKTVEQEIISNYYGLLNNGGFNNNLDLKNEYYGAMLCMAIGNSSGTYWGAYYINHVSAALYAQIADYAASMGESYKNKSGDIVATTAKGLTAAQASYIASLNNNWWS